MVLQRVQVLPHSLWLLCGQEPLFRLRLWYPSTEVRPLLQCHDSTSAIPLAPTTPCSGTQTLTPSTISKMTLLIVVHFTTLDTPTCGPINTHCGDQASISLEHL